MGLNFLNHVSGALKSTTGERTVKTGGAYGPDGKWVPGTTAVTTHDVNLQPLTNKQIQTLSIGAERITDYRQVWVNDGTNASVSESDTWTFEGVEGKFKVTQLDDRTKFGTRNYCKFIAVRIDPS